METKLLPCPFCGEEAKAYETNIGMDCSCWWNVECTVCEATMEGFGSERIAIRAWNTRHEKTCEAIPQEAQPFSNKYETVMIVTRWNCSECGVLFKDHKPNYCDNCGAKIKQ